MKLTEKVLIDLGFKRTDVSTEESGCDEPFYYFVYDLSNYVCLITQSSDETENGIFSVELFEGDGFGYCETKNEVEELIRCLSRKKDVSNE